MFLLFFWAGALCFICLIAMRYFSVFCFIFVKDGAYKNINRSTLSFQGKVYISTQNETENRLLPGSIHLASGLMVPDADY